MDHLDSFEELERMARNAESSTLTDAPPSHSDVQRWQKLFKYSYVEAQMLISAHRGNVTRVPVTDEHWDLVSSDLESRGYDREAYEHSLELKDLMKSQTATVHDTDGNKWTLMRLGGVLESKEKVKEIAGLKETPKVTSGEGSMQMSEFVWLDDASKRKVEEWVEMQQGGVVFTKGRGEASS